MARYRQRYQAEGKEMGKLEFQNLNIDLLSRKSAVVTGKWQLTMSDGKQPHGIFTLILQTPATRRMENRARSYVSSGIVGMPE